MPDVGSLNISFSGLRGNYNTGGLDDADDDSGLNAGNTNTALSDFRTANFDDDSAVPSGSDAISIGSHFRNKTFGSASSTYYLKVTNDGSIMGNATLFVQIRHNSGDDVNSAEIHYGAESAVTLEIVDDSTPTSGITINFVNDVGIDLTNIVLSDGSGGTTAMSGSITYIAPGLLGGATSITFGATGTSEIPLTMGITADAP